MVPVEELSRLHLQGELKEITRVFTLVRKAQLRGMKPKDYRDFEEYRLGTGHVKVFYTKLMYVLKRYHQLNKEMISRGYNPQPVPYKDLVKDLDSAWFKDYTPTQEAIEINRQRIKERS